MPLCDQFIYTSAKRDTKEGYQVIARSSGVSDEIITDMHPYLYPIGLDPQRFDESRSIIILKNEIIAYSIVKNIGIGYDTRKGTLYNHTFILRKLDFRDLDYDSRLLDKFFILDPDRRNELKKIRIDKSTIPIKFESLNNMNRSSLEYLLYLSFLGNKIALLNGRMPYDLIQNYLACLPPTMRLVSFSSLVNEPQRQPGYEIIQMSKRLDYKLSAEWTRLDISDSNLNSDAVRRIGRTEELEYIANLILHQDQRGLREIHREFQQTQGTDRLSKIRFVLYPHLLKTSTDKLEKAEYAYHYAEAARKLGSELAPKLLGRAKRYSIEAGSKELLAMIEIGELALLTEKNSLSLSGIEKILSRIPKTNEESTAIVLAKLLQKKTRDSPSEVLNLVKETITSHSPYRDDLLAVFFQNRFVEIFVVQFLSNLQLNISHKEDLMNLSTLVSIIYANHNLREKASPEMILEMTKKIRVKFEISLKENDVKDDSAIKPVWNSKGDYEMCKQISFDIVNDILHCLRYVVDNRKNLKNDMRSSMQNEIMEMEALLSKLDSIYYKNLPRSTLENNPPNWFDIWLAWFGLK
jgi:hypothetical protein